LPHDPPDLSVTLAHGDVAMDRRVARTRASLHRALVSLILAKGYEATTVEEICASADVSRSTFYAHYAGKDDLKRSGLDQLRALLVARHRAALAAADARSRRLSFSLPMLQHARDHVELYRALVGGRGGALSLGLIRDTLAELVREELAADAPSQGPPRELTVQFVVGAFMAVMTAWLDEGAQRPPEAVDAGFRQLALDGVFAPAA
jgi:AcrR family transcriptional regulator